MTTTINEKGQVTLPKHVRDAANLKPGDQVEIRATASGGVYIEKPGARDRYEARLRALAKRRPIRGITTDEIMEMSRGESESFRPKKKMTLVDTNVLLDILTDDPAWLDWSAEQLDRQAVQKPLIINEVRFHNVLFYVSSFHLEHRATESFD